MSEKLCVEVESNGSFCNSTGLNYTAGQMLPSGEVQIEWCRASFSAGRQWMTKRVEIWHKKDGRWRRKERR